MSKWRKQIVSLTKEHQKHYDNHNYIYIYPCLSSSDKVLDHSVKNSVAMCINTTVLSYSIK